MPRFLPSLPPRAAAAFACLLGLLGLLAFTPSGLLLADNQAAT